MPLWLFILVVLVVLALFVYALDLFPHMDPPIKNIIKIVLIVGAALWILARAGLIHM